MKKFLVVVFCLILNNGNTQKLGGAINFQLAFPQGEYKEVNGKTGIGGRFNLLFKPVPHAPIYTGLEVGLKVLGSTTEIFRTTQFGFYDQYRVSATNNAFSIFLNLRVDPLKENALFRPFIDGMMGWNDFYSTITVERETLNGYDDVENNNSSKGRWAMAYGGSGGVNIRLDKKASAYLELKTSYLLGNNTKYLTNPRINNDGSATFIEKESETNMIIPQVGLRFGF